MQSLDAYQVNKRLTALTPQNVRTASHMLYLINTTEFAYHPFGIPKFHLS